MEVHQLDQLFEDHHLINKVIKLRLYPTDELANALPQLSGNERFVWNRCVTFNRYHHALFPDSDPVDNYALIPEMTKWKKQFKFLKYNDATGLQKVVERFSTALKNMLNYYKGIFITESTHEKSVFQSISHENMISMLSVAKLLTTTCV